MEGKVIKEESVSVGSPCSPLSLPSGKENRRVGSPLTNTEILTRSRSKVLSKENSHHHHHHHHPLPPHHHRMSESPKASGVVGNGSPSPPVSSVNLTTNKTSSNTGTSNNTASSSSSHLSHSSGGTSSSSSLAAFHHFSSPHSTTTSQNNNGPSGIVSSNGSLLSGRTPSPTHPSSSNNNGPPPPRDRDGSVTTGGSSASSSSAGRTPSSSSSSNNSSGGSAPNTMGHGNSRLLVKIKRFLGTLLHFGCDISPDVGDRVRTLVFNLVSGHLSIEEFHHTLQEVTSFPLRPFVLPFLRAHLPLLQREISHLARLAKQTPLSYVQGHEQVIIDTGSSPGEPCDIFHSEASDLSLPGKRKASESFYENGDMSSESSGYSSTPKRHHGTGSLFSPPFFLASAATSSSDFREFYGTGGGGSSGYGGGLSSSGPGSQHHLNHSSSSSSHHHDSIREGPGTPSNGLHCKGGPEDEWKNIHVMLNCILSMVEKTKRALGILQSRTAHTDQSEGASSSSWLRRPSMYTGLESSEDIKRQVGEMMAQAFRATEDRVSEVKRRAEEAVQEVKRQALVELKRAVAAAEARACEAVASERARLERVLLDSRRAPGEICSSIVVGVGASSLPIESEACWNCGRKAHETCSGCNTARYCSSFCQHKDWENHHAVCGRSSSTNSERVSGGGGGSSGAAATENNKNPHPHESTNSSPINVSNPSPENPSPNSNH